MKNMLKKIVVCAFLFGLNDTYCNPFEDELSKISDMQTLRVIKQHLKELSSSHRYFCTKAICSWCNNCSDEELEARKKLVSKKIIRMQLLIFARKERRA